MMRKWLTTVSITARRAGAYYAMKLALWLDTEITIRLCLALTQENIRRQMEMQVLANVKIMLYLYMTKSE